MEAVSGGRRLVCADGGQNRQRTAAAFLHPPNHRVQPLSTDLATIPPPHTVILGRMETCDRLWVGIFRHYCTAMIWPSRSTVNRAIFVFDSRTLSALKVMNLKICPHRHFTRFDCWRQSNKCMYCVFRLCFDCYIQWIQQLCNRTVIIELPLLVV